MPWNQVSIVEQRLGFLIEASKRIEMSNQNRGQACDFCDSRFILSVLLAAKPPSIVFRILGKVLSYQNLITSALTVERSETSVRFSCTGERGWKFEGGGRLK